MKPFGSMVVGSWICRNCGTDHGYSTCDDYDVDMVNLYSDRQLREAIEGMEAEQGLDRRWFVAKDDVLALLEGGDD